MSFRWLTIARYRIAERASQAPLLFFAVVIGVAVLFKLAIGWAQPSVTPDAETTKTSHEQPPSSSSSASLTFGADPAAQPLPATTSTAGAGAVLANPANTSTSPRRHKHHPRSH